MAGIIGNFKVYQFVGKYDLDEILYMKMISKEDALQSDRIGTFLHYAILDATLATTDKHIQSMIGNLQHLFSYKENDILLMAKFLGLNDFKNLNLLKPYELINHQVDLKAIEECYNGLKTEPEKEQKFKKVKSKLNFFNPSPCFNLTNHPNCTTFCNWHKDAFAEWNILESFAIERYNNFKKIFAVSLDNTRKSVL